MPVYDWPADRKSNSQPTRARVTSRFGSVRVSVQGPSTALGSALAASPQEGTTWVVTERPSSPQLSRTDAQQDDANHDRQRLPAPLYVHHSGHRSPRGNSLSCRTIAGSPPPAVPLPAPADRDEAHSCLGRPTRCRRLRLAGTACCRGRRCAKDGRVPPGAGRSDTIAHRPLVTVQDFKLAQMMRGPASSPKLRPHASMFFDTRCSWPRPAHWQPPPPHLPISIGVLR